MALIHQSTFGAGELRFLALGDSYTIGEAVAADERWPAQVAAALRADGFPVAEPRIVATTGWTTDELSAAMDSAAAELDSAPWDLVSLSIGVNNQYRGRSAEEFEHEFAALLARATALAGHRPQRVLVLTIPDWGVTPFGAASGRDPASIASELDAFNAAVLRVARNRGVRVADIVAVSRRLGASMVAADGLHPSGALYREWARIAHPIARELLSE